MVKEVFARLKGGMKSRSLPICVGMTCASGIALAFALMLWFRSYARDSDSGCSHFTGSALSQYNGQLLLVAAETAIEKKMHWRFRDGVAEQLTSWHRTGHFFRAPILKDPEFGRRWETVKRKLKCPIPGISEEP